MICVPFQSDVIFQRPQGKELEELAHNMGDNKRGKQGKAIISRVKDFYKQFHLYLHCKFYI